jgi:hypothetical protein
MFLQGLIAHFPVQDFNSYQTTKKIVENGKESKHLQCNFLCKETKYGR